MSPPWGPEVRKALDTILNDLTVDSTNNNEEISDDSQPGDSYINENTSRFDQQTLKQRRISSFERAEEATSLIMMAFQLQNDVEQGARLGRKNMQVMDRLAKMQAHKRNSITKIRDSYGR